MSRQSTNRLHPHVGQWGAAVLPALLVAGCLFGSAVPHQAKAGPDTAAPARAAGDERAAARRAAALAVRQKGGKVLSSKPLGDGRYRVRLLSPDGRVSQVVVRPAAE